MKVSNKYIHEKSVYHEMIMKHEFHGYHMHKHVIIDHVYIYINLNIL